MTDPVRGTKRSSSEMPYSVSQDVVRKECGQETVFPPRHLSISVWPLRPQFCTLGVLPKITFKLTIIGYRKNLQI